MKASDAQLQRDVLTELRWNPSVTPGTIGVAVWDGVVSLAGEVDSLAEKRAAIRAAERVPGVRAVSSNVLVKIPGAAFHTDSDIAHEAANLLSADDDIPESVKVRVEDGWVWLEGTTPLPAQREAAERVIRSARGKLQGVRGITNAIVVGHEPDITSILMSPGPIAVVS